MDNKKQTKKTDKIALFRNLLTIFLSIGAVLGFSVFLIIKKMPAQTGLPLIISGIALICAVISVVFYSCMKSEEQVRQEKETADLALALQGILDITRKSQKETDDKISQMNEEYAVPAEEIVNAIKALAKITIGRSKENADAQINSNSVMSSQIMNLKTEVDKLVDYVEKAEPQKSDNSVQPITNNLIEKIDDITHKLKQLDDDVERLEQSQKALVEKPPVIIAGSVISGEVHSTNNTGKSEKSSDDSDIDTSSEENDINPDQSEPVDFMASENQTEDIPENDSVDELSLEDSEENNDELISEEPAEIQEDEPIEQDTEEPVDELNLEEPEEEPTDELSLEEIEEQSDELSLEEPEESTESDKLSLEEPDETSNALNLDESVDEQTDELSLDEPGDGSNDELSLDEPEKESTDELSLNEPEDEPTDELSLDEPEESIEELSLDEPEDEPTDELSLDEPEDEPTDELSLDEPEGSTDELSLDEPEEIPDELNLETEDEPETAEEDVINPDGTEAEEDVTPDQVIEEPEQPSEEQPADTSNADSNKKLSPDDIAALFAQASDSSADNANAEETPQETPKTEDTTPDPNRMMTPEEIEALFSKV